MVWAHNKVLCNYKKEKEKSQWTDMEIFPVNTVKWKKAKWKTEHIECYFLCKKEGKTRK